MIYIINEVDNMDIEKIKAKYGVQHNDVGPFYNKEGNAVQQAVFAKEIAQKMFDFCRAQLEMAYKVKNKEKAQQFLSQNAKRIDATYKAMKSIFGL